MNTTKPFLAFCKKIATSDNIVDDIDINDVEVPEKYLDETDNLISSIKPKLNRLDKISISFIQNVFEDIDNVVERLNEDCILGDIPDSIINYLSSNLYGKTFGELTDDEMSIIKVLACYICIPK